MKMVVENREDGMYALPTKEVFAKNSRLALSPMSLRILEALAEKTDYPKSLAKRLKLHEQKVYYHIRILAEAGMINVEREENINGVMAKYYSVPKPAFTIMLREMEKTDRIIGSMSRHEKFLEPFVQNGILNATIIMGSPDPHGPNKARAKDGIYAINLGLFLGRFLGSVPNDKIKLDTEIAKEDLKQNLIIIGGPGVNQVLADINNKLPIKFVESQKRQYGAIKSDITGKTYSEDECGLIIKAKNPWDASKNILVIAGRRASGTRAAIVAFSSKLESIEAGNRKNPKQIAKVFEGIDSNSDGIVDGVEERE